MLTANNNFRIVLNPWFHPPILRLVRCLSTDFPVGAPSATPAGGGGGDDGERRSKKLFTPGPLGVSPTVRAALTRDLGSRDGEFIALVKSIREQLVDIAGERELIVKCFGCCRCMIPHPHLFTILLRRTPGRKVYCRVDARKWYVRRGIRAPVDFGPHKKGTIVKVIFILPQETIVFVCRC